MIPIASVAREGDRLQDWQTRVKPAILATRVIPPARAKGYPPERVSFQPWYHRLPARLTLIVCLFSALAGCGDDGGTPGGIAIEIGTGTVDFEPLTPEQDLALIAGPQGGHHFILHARARGIIAGDSSRPGLPENPATVFEVWQGDRQVDPMFPPYRLGYVQADDGWLAMPSGRIVTVIEGDAAGLFDTRVRLRVTVTDAADHTTSDEVFIHVFEDPNPPDDDGGVEDAGPPDAGPDAAVADAG